MFIFVLFTVQRLNSTHLTINDKSKGSWCAWDSGQLLLLPYCRNVTELVNKKFKKIVFKKLSIFRISIFDSDVKIFPKYFKNYFFLSALGDIGN